MSVRATFLAVFVTLFVLLLASTLLTWHVIDLQAQIGESENRRYESYKLADELRQSSDDLTRLARTYVVTADPRYEQHFYDVLAIRNGKKPRPDGYQGIYWDLVLVGKGRTGAGPAISLQALMEQMGFTQEEFAMLNEAQSRSDALVRMEATAMNAVKGRFADDQGKFTRESEPDMALARELMHGREYHAAKALIMEPIGTFFQLIEARTSAETSVLRADGERAGWIAFALAVMTVLFALAAFTVLRRRIVRPLEAMASRFEDIAAGEGDLTQRITQDRDDEFGALSHWFNAFLDKVHGIMTQVANSTTVVSSAATQIAASAVQQESTVQIFGRSAATISSAVTEISATSDELAHTMSELATAAESSAGTAAEGRADLDRMETTMQGLSDSMERISARLSGISTTTDEITFVVDTINRVADQTNLLSVNAAIEAEKAGEAGSGFLVVAREIRRLADQTAAATQEIEESVTKMQSAVSAGVMEMDNFGKQVQHGVTDVGRIGTKISAVIGIVEGLTARFGGVNEGMAQQNQGARQIRESMRDLHEGADETVDALGEFSESSRHLGQAADRLRGQVGQFKLDGV